MLSSLRGRLLFVTVAVSVVAVLATAVISQQVASDDLRDALDRDLETQDEIVEVLNDYVGLTGTWEGVDEIVDELADRTDERVAVIDDLGRTIADSDPGATLPSQPTGVVDARELLLEKLEDDEETLAKCEVDALVIVEEDDGRGVAVDDARFLACLDEVFGTTDLPVTAFVYVGEGDATAASILGQNGPDARLVAVALVVLAAAVGLMVMALRPVLAPIASLRAGAQRLGDGDLDTRVAETGATELVELAHTFNSMAESLQEDDERRRRWTSDVAHELRSPLQNLRGHLEAAQDGLMKADDAWFDSVVDEVGQLPHPPPRTSRC